MIKHLLLLLSIILIAGSTITQAQELEARVTINEGVSHICQSSIPV